MAQISDAGIIYAIILIAIILFLLAHLYMRKKRLSQLKKQSNVNIIYPPEIEAFAENFILKLANKFADGNLSMECKLKLKAIVLSRYKP